LINEAEHRPRTAVETYLLRGFEALLGVRELPPPARQPRKPTLESLLKQADRAGKNVKGAESYPDRTVLQFGEPEPAGSADPWPLDEFRTKETKQ
jgi:hypothetical protein